MAARGLGEKYQGSHWIRPEKRLAIYIRDGLACAWCGETLEQSALSLDHLVPHCEGGGNAASNLVTSCKRCNSRRGSREWREWAESLAGYLDHGVQAAMIISRIVEITRRPLDIAAARAIIAKR